MTVEHRLQQSTVQHHRDDADTLVCRNALLQLKDQPSSYYRPPDAQAFLQASFFRKWIHVPYTPFSYIYIWFLPPALHFESARASAVKPDIAIPMCLSISTIFFWYVASSFGLLAIIHIHSLQTFWKHWVQHIYSFEFHSMHFPAFQLLKRT